MSKWIVLASLAAALISPALAGVAPAPGGGQQAMSGAKVKQPEPEQQHGKDQPESKQDEHK
jgi:hypothetical protein